LSHLWIVYFTNSRETFYHSVLKYDFWLAALLITCVYCLFKHGFWLAVFAPDARDLVYRLVFGFRDVLPGKDKEPSEHHREWQERVILQTFLWTKLSIGFILRLKITCSKVKAKTYYIKNEHKLSQKSAQGRKHYISTRNSFQSHKLKSSKTYVFGFRSEISM